MSASHTGRHGEPNGDFRLAMSEFKGAVLARLDSMDKDRALAREETRATLDAIQKDVATLNLRFAYAKGKVAGIAAAASIAVAALWHTIKTLLWSAHQ